MLARWPPATAWRSCAQEPPLPAGAVQSGAGQVAPGAGCIVLGAMGLGSAGAMGAGAPLRSESHMHGDPLPKGGTPYLGAGSKAVPPGPDLPLAIVSPHPMEQGAAGSSPASGLGQPGRLKPKQLLQLLLLLLLPLGAGGTSLGDSCGWGGGAAGNAPPHLRAYLGSIPSPRGSQKRGSPPSPSALRGASWHLVGPLPSPVAPPLPPANLPPVTESSPQPVGAKLTWSHS